MEKDHFEILLEHIEGNTQLLAEGLVGVNERLDRVEGRLGNVEGRLDGLDRLEAGQQMAVSCLDRLEAGQQMAVSRLDRLEAGLEVIKSDVRDTKRNTGLLNPIANDHESRLQGVESKLKDHLDNHS
jgi:hypothetical protein